MFYSYRHLKSLSEFTKCFGYPGLNRFKRIRIKNDQITVKYNILNIELYIKVKKTND